MEWAERVKVVIKGTQVKVLLLNQKSAKSKSSKSILLNKK